MHLKLSETQKEVFAEFYTTIISSKYIPQDPTKKQAEFLLKTSMKEGFYGGAARG